MARNFDKEREVHKKILEENKGKKDIEEAQNAHLKKIDEDEAKAKKKAERKAKIEANLDANDAGAKAVEFQNRMVNGDSVVNKPAEEEHNPLINEVDDTVVQDVIAGKYGTGQTRRENLMNAGYDPDEVQKKVNDTVSANKPAEQPTKQSAPTTNEAEIENQVNEDLRKEVQDIGNKAGEINGTGMFDVAGLDPKTKELLENTDEAKIAQEAVDTKDPTKLQNVTTPEGEGVLKGSYDKDGKYVPKVYTIDSPEVTGMSRPMAGALTIISVALSALGGLMGIPLMPINFNDLFGKRQETVDAMNKQEEDYASLINEPKKAGDTQAESIGGVQRGYEAQAQSASKNPDLYNTETQNKVAGAQAAVGGQNTALDVQGQQQEFTAEQRELDRQFEKEMANINIDNEIKRLNAEFANNKEMAELLYDQDVQRLVKKVEYLRSKGLTDDDIAKYISAEAGTTKLARGLGYAQQGASAASEVLRAVFRKDNSDKNVKKYDWGKSNTNMLRNSFKWR